MVLEDIHRGLEATPIYIRPDDKAFLVGKRFVVKTGERVRKPFILFDRVILGLSSQHAKTIESVVRLTRPESREAINEGELEALVFRGLWGFINRYRGWAASKLNVHELDLLLAHIDITDVHLGVHRVFNPLGLHARELLLTFRGTFIAKQYLPLLKRLREIGKELFVAESGSVIAATLAETNNILIHVDTNETAVFVSHKDEERFHHSTYAWGVLTLVRSVADLFAIEEDIAVKILDWYTNNQVSVRMKRILERRLKEQLHVLFEMFAPLSTKLFGGSRPMTHCYFSCTAPFLEKWVDEPYICFASIKEKLESKGFIMQKILGNKPFLDRPYESAFSLAAYPFTIPQYAFLNQMLKRRVRWLIPHL